MLDEYINMTTTGFCLRRIKGGSFFHEPVIGLKTPKREKWLFKALILYNIKPEADPQRANPPIFWTVAKWGMVVKMFHAFRSGSNACNLWALPGPPFSNRNSQELLVVVEEGEEESKAPVVLDDGGGGDGS